MDYEIYDRSDFTNGWLKTYDAQGFPPSFYFLIVQLARKKSYATV